MMRAGAFFIAPQERMNEQDRTPAPAAAAPDADTGDADFLVESASVPFDLPPADTTARPEAAAPAAEEPVVEEPVSGTSEESLSQPVETPEGEETSAAAAARARDEKTGQFAKAGKGKKKTADERIAEITFKHREAERRADEAIRKAAEIERRLQAIERGEKPAATAAPAAKVEEKPAAPAMPVPPKYRDFDTDEAYEAAYGKYQADIVKWQADRETALKSEITSGLDTRLQAEDQRRAATAAEAAFIGRIAAARQKYQDWDARAQNLQDVRSSWYDPTKHGDAATPFLSDLVRTHPAGEEVLYWLGEDPDRAQALADLLPTRPVRDALVLAPSPTALLDHFATPDGAKEFEALKRMHPGQVLMTVGALSARLAAPSGSAPAARHSITAAVPPARPPAGSPGARTPAAAAAGHESYEAWHARMDREEQAERLKRAGVTA